MAVLEVLDTAGFVGPWLAALAGLLWYALGARAWVLFARAPDGTPRVVREAREAARGLAHLADLPDPVAEALVAPQRMLLRRHAVLVRAVVAVAPLAGLLGTVTGMIETFDSLGTMTLFSRGGGIGAGIGEAMVSTQLGLVVAVPGLLLGAALEQRQATVEEALDEALGQLVRSAP